MLQTTYVIENEPKLYDALEVEEPNLQTARATVHITKKQDTITILLSAKDYTAFRAINTAIMRLLTTYYKVKGL